MSNLVGLVVGIMLIFSNLTPMQQQILKDVEQVTTWKCVEIRSQGEMSYEDNEGYEIFFKSPEALLDEELEAELKSDGKVKREKVAYTLEGYIDFENKEAHLKANLRNLSEQKNLTEPQEVVFDLFIKNNIVYANKDYLIQYYGIDVFAKAPTDYIAFPIEREAWLFEGKSEWVQMKEQIQDFYDLFKAKGCGISLNLPIEKKGNTYTLEIDSTQMGELLKQYGHQVVDNLDAIAMAYLEITEPNLTATHYDWETETDKKITYPDYQSYYEGEIKPFVTQAQQINQEFELIERLMDLFEAGSYGSQAGMSLTIDEKGLSGKVNANINWLKGNTYSCDATLEVKPISKQAIKWPTSVYTVYDLWDYRLMSTTDFIVEKGYTLEALKAGKLKCEKGVGTYAYQSGKAWYVYFDRGISQGEAENYIGRDPKRDQYYAVDRNQIDYDAFYEALDELYSEWNEDETGNEDIYWQKEQDMQVVDYLKPGAKAIWLDTIEVQVGEEYIPFISVEQLSKIGSIWSISEANGSTKLVLSNALFE